MLSILAIHDRGILFICARVGSFASLASLGAQINNIPSKSHAIPLLTDKSVFTFCQFTVKYGSIFDSKNYQPQKVKTKNSPFLLSHDNVRFISHSLY